jgi:hypothetical protein
MSLEEDMEENSDEGSEKPKDLTDDQKSFILLNYDKKSIMEMTRELSGNDKADGRHYLGRLIREFLVSQNKKYETSKFKLVPEFKLTEEHEEFIRNNISSFQDASGKVRVLELCRVLFKNDKMTPLNKEARLTVKFLDKILPGVTKKVDVMADEDYKPPSSIFLAARLVNKYVTNPKKENEPIYKNFEKLSSLDTRCLTALISYLKINRLSYVINEFRKQIDREIFESSFIGMVYDKPDLLREEVEQYISLCSEIVTTAQIDRHIQTLEEEIEGILNGSNMESKKLSMTLIELVNGAREKLDKSKERQRKLLDELTESRSVRIKNKMAQNASVLNLVEAWKMESSRKELIELAELEKKSEEDEINRLSSLDRVVALIAGISKNEALH